MACKCQQCGERYKVDLLVPNEIWERIQPNFKPQGAGLLCGLCIMKLVEALGEYRALSVVTK